MNAAASTRTVWHLLSNRWNSAITEYALSAARAFELIGFNSVFSPLENSPAFDRATNYGLEVKPLPGFGVSAWGRAAYLAKQIKPDLIMTYGGPETILSQLLGSSARIVRFRGQELEPEKPGFEFRQRVSHSRVSKIITPSASLAAKLALILPEKKPEVVPLGCDRNIFHPTGDWTNNPERPELVILGRLDPVKGHAFFFKVFASMLKIWPENKPKPLLRVIGQAANLKVADMEQLAAASGLTWEQDIKLTAVRVRSLAGVLSRATLGVIPSLGSEIICRVAHEFSLCGTPILVSGVGSLEEALFDGAGASYQGLNDESIVQLLCDLTEHAMGETLSQRKMRADVARQHYSLDAMGACLKHVLAL